MMTERHGGTYREVVRRMGQDGWLDGGVRRARLRSDGAFAIDYNRTGGGHRPRGAEDPGTSVNQVPGDAPVLVTAGTGVPTSDLIFRS